MQHDHLKFFNNSASNAGTNPSNIRRSVVMGGVRLVPELIRFDQNESKMDTEVGDSRSDLQKQVEIIDYLKKLPSDAKVNYQ
jgi:hypothetical protein